MLATVPLWVVVKRVKSSSPALKAESPLSPMLVLPKALKVEQDSVGVLVGVLVGVMVGEFVGLLVGVIVGEFVGVFVGVLLGVAVGLLVGVFVGVLVGITTVITELFTGKEPFTCMDCPEVIPEPTKLLNGSINWVL